MYSVGQERRLVDPPSQVVAGVRTVTTNMDGRDALPRMSRPFAFVVDQNGSDEPATNLALVPIRHLTARPNTEIGIATSW